MDKINHIAVIPDGNRRWAKKHGLKPYKGHSKGLETFRKITDAIFKAGIPYFTFWAASEDNLRKRKAVEVQFLVFLLLQELKSKELLKKCQENEIRLRILGNWHKILENDQLLKVINTIEGKTFRFERHHLTLLFGYDGRREMIETIQKIKRNKLNPEQIDENVIKNSLWTCNLPPVDLVIRTGEEKPNWAHYSSGFMMWDTANAKLFFTETLWPDFSEEMLQEIIGNFSKNPRKFGA